MKIQQGNLDLEEYYSKLRLLWDEILGLRPTRRCPCDKTNRECPGCTLERWMQQDEEETKLLQFLLGLEERYEYIKDQVLMQDPWPDVYSSFTRIQNVEKKQKISHGTVDSAMFIKAPFERNTNQTKDQGRGESADKGKGQFLQCTHCGMKGHKREGYFKVIGYPDWWKQSKNKGKEHAVRVHNTSKQEDTQHRI